MSQQEACMSGKLVSAMISEGLNARQFKAGEGDFRVVVPLLETGIQTPVVYAENPEVTGYVLKAAENWPHAAYLYISTNGSQLSCKIGMIGQDGEVGEKYDSEQWYGVSDLAEAVAAFKTLWEQCDALINGFAGRTAQSGE